MRQDRPGRDLLVQPLDLPGPDVALGADLAQHAARDVVPQREGEVEQQGLAAVLGRYAEVAAQAPELTDAELAIVARLLPPLAPVSALSGLWARIMDLARDGRLRPTPQAEELARRLRGLTPTEGVALLEAIDQAALAKPDAQGARP
jgi:hypothetical protein